MGVTLAIDGPADGSVVVDVGKGVVQQIPNDDPHLIHIDVDQAVTAAGALRHQVPGLNPRQERQPALLQEVIEVDPLFADGQLPRVGPGQEKKILDHRLEVISHDPAVVDDRFILRRTPLGRERQTSEGGLNSCQRGAKFVSHIGGKRPFAGKGLIEPPEQAIEFIHYRE